MEHSRLDFTAAGTANDFFHTFPNYISGKNILSNVFSYAAVAALILLLIIILPCIVRILRQSIQRLATELHLAVLRNKKREDALEEEMTIHSSILARKIPWIEESSGLQYIGSQRVEHN